MAKLGRMTNDEEIVLEAVKAVLEGAARKGRSPLSFATLVYDIIKADDMETMGDIDIAKVTAEGCRRSRRADAEASARLIQELDAERAAASDVQ